MKHEEIHVHVGVCVAQIGNSFREKIEATDSPVYNVYDYDCFIMPPLLPNHNKAPYKFFMPWYQPC
jgi:hypothetical protein